jgi:hypothetical protein
MTTNPVTSTDLNRARQLLTEAKKAGLSFAACIEAFAPETQDEKIYAEYARARRAVPGECEIDEPTVVSIGADPGAYVMAWIWITDAEIWQGPTDSDGKPCRRINHYHCKACAVSWQDQWSCACNDECPRCYSETEPRKSVELDLQGNPIDEQSQPAEEQARPTS